MYCGGGHLGFTIGMKKKNLVLYKFYVFHADQKSKMAATVGHRLTLDPIGECSNVFFSETTNIIKAKLYMNVHWVVLYKLYVFCSDMKFKMAATAGLSLTPIGSNVNLCIAVAAILDFRSA
jgi:hypothetical protein